MIIHRTRVTVHRPRRLTVLLIGLAAATACLGGPDAVSPTLAIVPSAVQIAEGDTVRLETHTVASSGATPAAAPAWTSSDSTIASIDSTGLLRARRPGAVSVTAAQNQLRATATVTVLPAVLVGAGDIATCGLPGSMATGAILDLIPGVVFTAGDNAYTSGTAAQYADCYDPAWGRARLRTRPSPGNHDYLTDSGAPYYHYFGRNAGDSGVGYYSYQIGAWHVISLNSNVSVAPGSPQETWLRADLGLHHAACTVAYWHYPRFSAGPHGNVAAMQPLWQALYDSGADVVIAGHDHNYQRFAPQSPTGVLDSGRGIREFVVGTGGSTHYGFPNAAANLELKDSTTFGVLELTLHDSSYDWLFVPAAGGGFTDRGSARCH